MPCRTRSRPSRPLLPLGTSTWVTSPVTTTREPKPMRVRNIFICSGVVFCASSRMMNDVVQRAAAHEGQRRDLDRLPFEQPLGALELDHVVQGVVERPQVRVDLRHQVAGEEAEPLPRLDGRSGEDDPLHLLGLQRLDRHRDGQPRLAGAGGTDSERDDVVLDGVDVALLAGRLRPDLAALGPAQHVVHEHFARAFVLGHHRHHAVEAGRVDLVALLEQARRAPRRAGRPCRPGRRGR